MCKNNNRILVFLSTFICLFIISFNSFANGHVDPRCEGLTGAAYGMCSAAVSVGCDDPDSQNGGCTTLVEKYTQITGEKAPWIEAKVCLQNLDCAADEYCAISKTTLDLCTDEGVCMERPVCAVPDPGGKETVCGCDGINYLSGCVAAQNSVRVLHAGYCK